MHKNYARQHGNTYRSCKTFPRFPGTNSRNHFVFADQRAYRIRACVAELGDNYEIKQVITPIFRRKEEKIDFLYEIEKPGDVHQSEQGGRNGEDARSVALRE